MLYLTTNKNILNIIFSIFVCFQVTEKDVDLSTFNTFQFWRPPLPEIDMSLLQNNDESPESSSGRYTRDTDSMET